MEGVLGQRLRSSLPAPLPSPLLSPRQTSQGHQLWKEGCEIQSLASLGVSSFS